MEAQNASFGNGQNDFNYRTQTLCHVSVEGSDDKSASFCVHVFIKKNKLKNFTTKFDSVPWGGFPVPTFRHPNFTNASILSKSSIFSTTFNLKIGF